MFYYPHIKPVYMKKMLISLFLLPLLGFGQENVISIDRFLPKADKVMDFEKALAAHVQKYHTGQYKALIYYTETGPDAGTYSMVMGPKTWTDWDSLNMGNEHIADFIQTVLPLADKYLGSYYMVMQPDLSSAKPGEFADKVSITHVYFKPGWDEAYAELLKKAKKVWEKDGEMVSVSRSNFSGQPQFQVAYRHKEGLKEKAPDFRKPFKERFIAMYSENEYNDAIKVIRDAVERTSGEILTMRKDLSSQ
jgi:hypothetical protein